VISLTQIPLPVNAKQSQEISIPPTVFEPVIPASKRPQTHAFGRTATGINI